MLGVLLTVIIAFVAAGTHAVERAWITIRSPYVVKVLNGVRVGVLGLTTPGVPSFENTEYYRGLDFRPAVPEARKWVAILRERANVVVVAMHWGELRRVR